MRIGKKLGGVLVAAIGVLLVVQCFQGQGEWEGADTWTLFIGSLLILGGGSLTTWGVKIWMESTRVANAAVELLDAEGKIKIGRLQNTTELPENKVRKYVSRAQKEGVIPLEVPIEGQARAVNAESGRNRCPVCNAHEVTVLHESGPLFRYTHDRSCQNCSAVWRPACPKWAAVLIILLCLPLTAVCAIGLFTIPSLFVGLVSASFGISGISGLAYGIFTLIGKAGKLKILQQGSVGKEEVDPEA